MAVREEPVVVLSCGHFASLGGAVRVLGAVMGQLEVQCERCDAWIKWKPKAEKKPRKPKTGQEDRLF